MKFKLGKLPPRHDSRTLRLAKYLLPSDGLPTPPDKVDYSGNISDWKMFANDKYGDCTWAARAHLTMLFTQLIGKQVTPNEADVTAGYLAMSPDDEGCVILDVLNQWKNYGAPGLLAASDTIEGYAQLDLGNQNHIKLSVSMFAGNDIGFQVPNAIWDMGSVWDIVDNDGGIDGGHSVCLCGYNQQGVLVVSWGKIYTMTWAFWQKYCDESYVVLSNDWKNQVPNGCEGFAQLAVDLGKVGQEIR